jgi:hypothetical protein
VILAVLGLASLAYASHSLAVERGWQPVIALAGGRDSVRTLRETARLWGTALRDREVDCDARLFGSRA